MSDSCCRPVLLAGSAKEIITPPLGTLLFGYPFDRPAAGVNDDLTASAVVFSDEKVTVGIVSITVCSIRTDVCDRVRELLKGKAPINNIIFATSHTHSGPATASAASWGASDTSYIDDILVPKLVKVLTDAYNTLRPAEIGIGETNSNVGVNRRNIKEDGSVWLGVNPWGIYDSRMRVISVRSTEDKTVIASMVHFGAHGTAAGNNKDGALITRDWSGVMTDRLETITGAPCLFLLGAEGDVAPRNPGPLRNPNGSDYYERIDHMLELGGRAACDASEAYEKIKRYEVLPLGLIEGEIALPYEPLPDVETAKKALAEIEGKSGPLTNYERAHWQSVIEYADKPVETALAYKQVIIKLGDIVIVPHPFEIFQSIALRLDSYSPYTYTLSLANANGTYGYLPAKEDIIRGGYEVWSARYREGYVLTEDADTEIVQQNLKLLRDNM